jgi:hypothetical protein
VCTCSSAGNGEAVRYLKSSKKSCNCSIDAKISKLGEMFIILTLTSSQNVYVRFSFDIFTMRCEHRSSYWSYLRRILRISDEQLAKYAICNSQFTCQLVLASILCNKHSLCADLFYVQ